MSDEADSPEWQHATETLHNMLTSVSQFIDSMDVIGICPDIVATLTRAGLIQEPHPRPHPDALADPFYSAAPLASAPDPPPAASGTGSMSPHKRRASTEEPDLLPSRNYAPFNGTHRLQCCHCGTLESRFSWRYWMKDKTFRLCSKCNGRFERRHRMTKKQPMDDEEGEGGEEGAEVDEEDADEERVVSKAAGRKGKGKARDDTGSRAPGSSSSSNHNNHNSSSTGSGRGHGAIPAQRAGAGDGGSSSSARTPRGAAPPRTGSETAQRGRPAAGTAEAAAQRTLRSDDAQDGDGGIGTGTDERGGAAAAPAARASAEEGRDDAPPPSVPRKIASALSSSPDRLEEQTGGGADNPSDAELEDNPPLNITAPPSFRPPIASFRSAGGAGASAGGAPAGGAPAGSAGSPAAAASRSAPAGAAVRRSTRTPATRTPSTRGRGLQGIYEDSDDGDASPTRRLGPRAAATARRRP
ncbi:hypothetical protein OC844_003606 [Tilletia horrida]|nr:hypothetical protein OC844_003606 [Tilletia horrida]